MIPMILPHERLAILITSTMVNKSY